MDFEYDRQNSEDNKAMHGIDFDAAQALWQDPALIEIPARAMDEPRALAIAKMGGAPRVRDVHAPKRANPTDLGAARSH